MAALAFVATSSAAVLSAKRLAASSAFAAGSVVAGFVEYFGSTKANSAGFSAWFAAAVATVDGAGDAVTAATCSNFGAGLDATGFASTGISAFVGATFSAFEGNTRSVKPPFAPGVTSCWHLFVRSSTTRVLPFPSIPMRMSFTPFSPTGTDFCAAAIAVFGKSTTMRDGESRVLTLGSSGPFALNSTRRPSWP